MAKLRALENKAAIVIQRRFRDFKKHVLGGQARSRACQTEARSAFELMSENFYSQIQSEDLLLNKLKKSMFEAYTLFYLATRIVKQRQRK